MSSTPGWGGRAMSAGRTISEVCATVPPEEGADRRGRAWDRHSAGAGGGRAVCVKAVSQGHEAAAHRAAAGDGDRRVRQGPVDARRRVAVRQGRAGEAVEVDRPADLYRAQGASSSSSAATSTTSSWRRCSSTRSSSRSGPTGPRRACWSPGASPKRARACCSQSCSGCANRTRTGSRSDAT
jgi:hypothetical protein